MKKDIAFMLLVCGAVYAAQLGTLSRSSDVVTATEFTAVAVDKTAIETRLDNIEAILSGGITGQYPDGTNFAITNGVVKGTY